MANQEHLEILKQEVEAWNKWRQENPGMYIDLAGVDLSTDWGDFRLADLQRVDIEEVNLTKVDLSHANLLPLYQRLPITDC